MQKLLMPLMVGCAVALAGCVKKSASDPPARGDKGSGAGPVAMRPVAMRPVVMRPSAMEMGAPMAGSANVAGMPPRVAAPVKKPAKVFACGPKLKLGESLEPFGVSSKSKKSLFPAVAMAADNRFVVAWVRGAAAKGKVQVVARRHDALGHPQGAVIVLRIFDADDELGAPAVSMGAAGRFVVVGTGVGQSLMAQRYDGAGRPLGRPLKVASNVDTRAIDAGASAVAMGGNGHFVVLWRDKTVWARRYDHQGRPQGGKIWVTRSENFPELSIDATGQFLVAWGDGHIYAMRFDPKTGAWARSSGWGSPREMASPWSPPMAVVALWCCGSPRPTFAAVRSASKSE